jgi:predicted acetyltransferase
VSAEHLSRLRADPAAFLRSLTGEGQTTIIDRDGCEVPRLPGAVRWIWDGEFCGGISLRYALGTDELPPHISGHIGFSVVPWKRRRGYATGALRAMLAIARAEGLRRVRLTCDDDNLASRRVIEKCGGVYSGTADNRYRSDSMKLQFWIET